MKENLLEIATAKNLLDARVKAEQGLSFVKDRNKLLKTTDQHGWDTVNLYTNDPLANDEEDHKCLRKAVKDAEKAREKAKNDCQVQTCRFARAKLFVTQTQSFSRTGYASPTRTSLHRATSIVLLFCRQIEDPATSFAVTDAARRAICRQRDCIVQVPSSADRLQTK